MFFKKHIVIKVYKLYLKGLPTGLIACHLDLKDDDVHEIIDYINEIYH